MLMNNAELATRVLAAVEGRRRAHYKLLDALGVRDVVALRPPEGAPHVAIWTPAHGEPLVQVMWGRDRPVVDVMAPDCAPALGKTGLLGNLLGVEPRAAAYADMKRDIEAELGCRLGAQTWSRPELVPAWAW
jgi:hypothetical protein